MTRVRNRCAHGADAIKILDCAIGEIRLTRKFKGKDGIQQTLTGLTDAGEQLTYGAYTMGHSRESDLVSVEVTVGLMRCQHQFWLDWPRLRMVAYMIDNCNC